MAVVGIEYGLVFNLPSSFCRRISFSAKYRKIIRRFACFIIRRPVFKFFRCSNDCILQKVYFSRLLQVQLGLVVGVYLVQVSLLLVAQQDLADFFRYRPLLPIGWKIVQILRQRRRNTTNTAPTTFSAICNTSSKPIHFYHPLVMSRNDKNKQLTLLSQRKLALTTRNTPFAI